jgi:diacylglycerol kinase (ATP)
MRVHFLFAVLLLLLGLYLNVTKVEFLILLMAIVFVLFAEMVNTALEQTVDFTTKGINPVVRIIKDVSAGAVLLSAATGFIVVYVIFSRYVNIPFEEMAVRIRHSPWHITFIALIVVLSLVIAGKVLSHSGTPLRGGMPSGHAALAFCIWTAIFFSTTNNFVIILAFILAFFVARSRTANAIHNIWEVISGAVLGVLATTAIFQILK